MALDFGTIAARGANVARTELDPTIKANMASVPGLKDRVGYYSNLMANGPDEQEIADMFNQQRGTNALRGQADSPAAILENVMGVSAYRRGVRNEAAGNLGNATQFMQLNPLQTGEAVSGALGAEQFNENMAFQDAMQSRAMGRGPGGPSDLTQFVNKAAPLALGAAGAMWGAPALAGGADAFAKLSPYQQAGLRLGTGGAVANAASQFFK